MVSGGTFPPSGIFGMDTTLLAHDVRRDILPFSGLWGGTLGGIYCTQRSLYTVSGGTRNMERRVSTVQHKEQAAPENVGRKTHKSRQKIDARGNRMGVLGFKH